MVSKGYKYKKGQKVFLKGDKTVGLTMDNVLMFGALPPWPEVTGIIKGYNGSHSEPAYTVQIIERWQHFFGYRGITLAESNIFTEGEKPNIEYLDEGLFEL